MPIAGGREEAITRRRAVPAEPRCAERKALTENAFSAVASGLVRAVSEGRAKNLQQSG
jgi:hypothetical protein